MISTVTCTRLLLSTAIANEMLWCTCSHCQLIWHINYILHSLSNLISYLALQMGSCCDSALPLQCTGWPMSSWVGHPWLQGPRTPSSCSLLTSPCLSKKHKVTVTMMIYIYILLVISLFVYGQQQKLKKTQH